LSSRARQNETRGNEKLNWRQKKTCSVVNTLVADNFEDLGICFHGYARMSVSNMERTFCPGKALSDGLRRGIIDTIVHNGGDYFSSVFLGNYSDVGRKFTVSGKTVKSIWINFCESGETGPRDKKGGQNPPHLTETDLEVIEVLKQSTPSMPLRKIQDVGETYCNVNGRNVISRTI